jgi:hypothetical protein
VFGVPIAALLSKTPATTIPLIVLEISHAMSGALTGDSSVQPLVL